MHADTHVHKWYMVKLDKVNLLVHLIQSFHIKPRKFTTYIHTYMYNFHLKYQSYTVNSSHKHPSLTEV